MDIYRIDFSPDGRASLSLVDKEVAQRVLDKLRWLTQNAERVHHLPLRGRLAGLFKLRVGEWRVIYYDVSHAEKVVTVHKVGHRREIYQ
jgi:mRNA interferase RelE/StbE